MIEERYNHKSVAVKNNFFVIGGLNTYDCEVFNLTTNKFTLLNRPKPFSKYNFEDQTEVITIDSKVFLFKDNSSVITYDFEYNEWSKKYVKQQKI